MKKLILLFVVVIMNVTFVAAKEVNPVDDYPKALKEITKLLGPLNIEGEFEKTVRIKFTAMVNSDNELIVLQVGTENIIFKKHIVEQLNYKKIAREIMTPGKEYTFIVKFRPE
ncbi:hypothetical protein SL053_000908 [Flavobacterium psychrophilum]|uniref:TonB C-terminal domain-containing protein n=2 Tax=Flavobacterium psychrophilum TaxID=96345 RepID=A6GY29_FLAPJ|nr:hypothetical protein [Flavobacterium psychrophilum]AIG29725.1 hypothetical protein IA03_04245 [Flavobacterium psychrophilum]AIG32002.1 hypothetical protein IA01_04260 [Flavobacterium psychrophilum]AIG34157.1 hypothetical protein IA02_03665 [Flavobacterium psychrophilum]AIG36520.1 hypothetical protein IA04_04160 [Flavobacterium psychrophilum]AIG38785.1 hypothetical protein IA05_04245 [Flavobacterium psychrophilum]